MEVLVARMLGQGHRGAFLGDSFVRAILWRECSLHDGELPSLEDDLEESLPLETFLKPPRSRALRQPLHRTSRLRELSPFLPFHQRDQVIKGLRVVGANPYRLLVRVDLQVSFQVYGMHPYGCTTPCDGPVAV